MSRVSNRGESVSQPEEVLSLVKDSNTRAELANVVFKPSDAQRQTKAKLRAALVDSLKDPKSLTIADIVRLTGNSTVNNWNREPGFLAWITDAQEHQQKLEYLFDLALDACKDILLNTDPKAQSARINAIKLVSELLDKFPKATKEDPNAAFSKMDKKQLEEYLSSNGIVLEKRLVLETPGPRSEATNGSHLSNQE